jgi:hypothetical protein
MYDRIKEAVDFAFEKHRGQYRKITKVPYIVHPLGVMEILLKEQVYSKFSDDVIIAGILHDIFEDTDVSLDEIEQKFGKRVRELVDDASEPEELVKVNKEEKINNWKERKEKTIQKLAGLNRESKFLIAADKLHNLRSLYEGKVLFGNQVWDNFSSDANSMEWYYGSILRELTNGESIKDSYLYRELIEVFFRVFGLDVRFEYKVSTGIVRLFIKDNRYEGEIKEGHFYPRKPLKDFYESPKDIIQEHYAKAIKSKIAEILEYYNNFKTE